MKVAIIPIGNSKGIRIPKPMLEQCRFGKSVEIEVENNRLILRPVGRPRSGWEDAFKAMPKLPARDARGERPAKLAVLAVMARSLIRRRMEAGLDQKRLAALAGLRPETISRIESGRYRPRRQTMLQIDQAFAAVTRKRRN